MNHGTEYKSCCIKIIDIGGCYSRCTISYANSSFCRRFPAPATKDEILKEAKGFIDHLTKW